MSARRDETSKMTEPRSFSWFVEGKLAGMAYPRETDLAFLAGQGIKTLVNLTPDDYYSGLAEQHGVQMKTIRVPAFEPPTLGQIQEFLELIDSTKEASSSSFLSQNLSCTRISIHITYIDITGRGGGRSLRHGAGPYWYDAGLLPGGKGGLQAQGSH